MTTPRGAVDLLAAIVAGVEAAHGEAAPQGDGAGTGEGAPAGIQFDSHRAFGPGLVLNVPAGARIGLAPEARGLRVQCDLAPWIGIEATLGADAPDEIALGIALLAERDVAVDLFLRATDADGSLADGPVSTLRLGLPGVTPGLARRPPGGDRDAGAGDAVGQGRRLVVLLREPPAEFLLTRLALDPAPAADRSAMPSGAEAQAPQPLATAIEPPSPSPAQNGRAAAAAPRRARKGAAGVAAPQDGFTGTLDRLDSQPAPTAPRPAAATPAAVPMPAAVPASRPAADADPSAVEPEPEAEGDADATAPVHIDFAFRDDRGTLILTGWSERAGQRLGQWCEDGGVRQPVRVVARFPRGDLGAAPLGLVAVVTGLPPAAAGGTVETVLTGPGGQRQVIGPGFADDAAMIELGLDETLAAMLRAMAAGVVAALSPTAMARLAARVLASGQAMPVETPQLALALDRAMVAPNGLGIASGWALTRTEVAEPLAGLVLAGPQLVPLGIVARCLPKHGLQPYGDRYRTGARDGMVAAFRLPAPAARQAATVVLLAADPTLGPALIAIPAQPATEADLAGAALALLDDMPATAERRALLSAIAGPQPQPLPPDAARTLPEAADCDIGTGTLLILVPDLGPADLRDLLRALLPRLDAPVTLRPLRAVAALADVVAAVTAETGRGLQLGLPLDRAGIAALTLPPGVEVVMGSAAALAQLGLPTAVPGQASVLMHDPLAALAPADEAPAGADAMAAPHTLRMPGALFAAAVAAAPSYPLTVEGLVAASFAGLAEAGRLMIARGGHPVYLAGDEDGTANATLDAALSEVAW